MIAHIAPPLPVARTFSYRVPDRLLGMVEGFMRVTVPFGTRTVTGYVTALEDKDGEGLKDLHGVLDPYPLVGGDLAPLIRWASRHYVAPMGVVLKYVLPASLRIERYMKVRRRLGDEGDGPAQPLSRAYRALGREAVLRGVREGSLVAEDIFTGRPWGPPEEVTPGGGPGGMTFLAGPMKVRLARYMEVAALHTARGENVLILLPDFKTAGQHVYRALKEEFGEKVYWYSSSVKAKARMEAYFRARGEGGLLILGNQSSSFMAVARLGLIIVERPEEDEYRNEEGFRFNASEVARQRGRIAGVPVVMGGPFPPFELIKEAGEGNLHLVTLCPWTPPRFNEVRVARKGDASEAPPEALVESVKASVEAGGRVAVYTPRKFYGSLIHCLECGQFFLCPRCHGMLSYAKTEDRLVCPRCSAHHPYRETCPHCGSRFIRFSRAGVEYLEEHFRRFLPETAVFPLTGDTVSKVASGPTDLYGHRPAVIVGTQVLSKLYDLKIDRLIVYGWEDMVSPSGFRATERILHTVLNLNDALTPREILFLSIGEKGISPGDFADPLLFSMKELEKRKIASFPPFVRLFSVESAALPGPGSGKALDRVMTLAREGGVEGFLAGPLFPDRDKNRWRILVRLESERAIEFLRGLHAIPGVRVEADPLDI